jgi:hypothetical protein
MKGKERMVRKRRMSKRIPFEERDNIEKNKSSRVRWWHAIHL